MEHTSPHLPPSYSGGTPALARFAPTYHDIVVNTTSLGQATVHYVEAGAPTLPTLLLLHGYPSSSNQFRDLIPLLSHQYHIYAPDLPGFGLTQTPAGFPWTFDNLAVIIAAWLAALPISSYAMYIFDYGAPVGLRLASNDPVQVKAIISQNGNAYVEGFGHPFWDPIMALWTNDSASNREIIRENVLTLNGTKGQYTAGVPVKDIPLIDPTAYHHDYHSNVAGEFNQEKQLDLFADYKSNVELYPTFQKYFRETRPPLLAIWGKGDPAFRPPGAEAFKKDLPDAVVEFVDAGHFALETQRWRIAEAVLKFLEGVHWY